MGKFSNKLRRFMYGRYGSDQLNTLIWGVGLAINIVALFIKNPAVRMPLIGVSYLLLGLSFYRMFSRKTWKRFEENKKFLAFFTRLRDRDHRYYKCPKCRQRVRVPKHKGKIAISCPKCREKFIRKT